MLCVLLYLSLRVAVDFLDPKCFCKHSHHVKGDALIRKRHLEILGYRVVQVGNRCDRLHVCLNVCVMWYKIQYKYSAF